MLASFIRLSVDLSMVKKWITFVLIFIVGLISCTKNKSLKDFQLLDLNNNLISLTNLKNKKATVFYFLAPECPLSQNYTKAINEINAKFNAQGIDFYGVFSGKVYTDDEIRSYMQEYDIKIKGVKDEKYLLSKYFKATITPEVFVINANEEIMYSGKIDNWIESLGVKRQVVTAFYLQDALTQLLNKEEIKIKKTEAVGCLLE